MNKSHIKPALFKFLRDLKANNRRDWFLENKSRFIEDVQKPLLEFIEDFESPLHKISPHFAAVAKVQGGSLFRIYRDTRFSKNKNPYKENAGVHFCHYDGKDVHAPGFYLHLEPGGCFAGVGLWHPDNQACGMIRQAIVDQPQVWKKIVRNATFKKTFGSLQGDSLKRPPRGFDPDHPLIDDLKRKDFIVVKKFSQKKICSSEFMAQFYKTCQTAKPFAKFLTQAVELPW